ncbi:hypothetical protein HMPREF0380_01316 [Eubacterium infirmum F0142]|nr:hypothetical protein HMPREF0380_01316 [Eubacterium infirmum F0142]
MTFGSFVIRIWAALFIKIDKNCKHKGFTYINILLK